MCTDPTTIQFRIVTLLKAELDANNPLVQKFRMVRDRFKDNGSESIKLKLIGRRDKDGRQYNLPNANEVAALIIGDFDGSGDTRDIVLEKCSRKLKRINELHPSYIALQYPLIFPHAEDGYRTDIFHSHIKDASAKGRCFLSMREWFAYRVQQRNNEKSLLLMSRKLFQQFLVDAFTMIENTRLYYIKTHQQILRISTVTNLNNALGDGQNDSSLVGNRVVLPSSFTGGARYMEQNYLDAITLCKWYGYPDLFITVTCNPKWPELCRILDELGLNSEDRPGLVARIFKIKLDNLIMAIKDQNILGRTMGVVYTIEFQKRGLPHAHICLFFHKDDKLPNPEDIDRIISAEMPDKENDAELYQLVSEFMIHGPCGKDNPELPCTKKSICTKGFPKKFNTQTYVDANDYPVYRRRNTGATVEKNGVTLDNRHVGCYNALLLRKYQSHINVEWCNQIGSIKYLFKNINKGPDRITVAFSHSNKNSSSSTSNKDSNEDEVQNYFDCRYVSACEASWRLFGFEIHYQTPNVERLSFHLDGQQPICYNPGDNLEEILSKPSVGCSQFLAWMAFNKENEIARHLTYVEFPQYYVWNKSSRKWTQRKKGYALGRMNYVPSKAGETYFLRILLGKVKGPTCYKDIKMVDDYEHKTCRDACFALGLLDDDNEYIESIKETSLWANGSFCRTLFVTLITLDSLSRADYVWEQTWPFLSDDILHNRRKQLGIPDLMLEDDVIKNICFGCVFYEP